METTIINNTERSHFEMEIKGEVAYVEYRFYKGDIVLMHTFVPEFARGKGISSKLAKFAMEYIKEQNLKLIVYCPIMAKYIRLHPEYKSLLDKKHFQAK